MTQAAPFPQGRRTIQWRLVSAGGASVLLLLGLYLRLDGFSRSLWLDEFGTFWAVEGDLVTAVHRVWQFHGQSPFYYVLAWISVHLVGESEVALRVPSLLFGCACACLLYLSARTLGGAKAGALALIFVWCSPSFVRASVEARPYGLVLVTVAAAVFAFQQVVVTGGGRARLLWVLAGAAVAWAHYLQYLVVMGLFLAYALLPELRRRYTAKWFVTDMGWQLALAVPSLPQILALFHRRQTLSFLDQLNQLAALIVLLPFVVVIIMGERGRNCGRQQAGEALRRALWIAMLTPVALLEAAALGGVNLLHPRYLQAIVVPGALLAATAAPRLKPLALSGALLWFSAVSGVWFTHTKEIAGTYSGIGFEDWRGAVRALSTRLERTPNGPVLYRSGFVEEDAPPLGSPARVTLAPLRSPGQEPLRWKVKSLTFRWDNPGRNRYFEEDIAPALEQSGAFYYLGGASSREPRAYADEFANWVRDKWPNRFRVDRARFGGVELVEFERR